MEDESSYRAEVRVEGDKSGRRVRFEEERDNRRAQDPDEDDDRRERRGRRLLGMAPVSADTVTDFYRGFARSLAEGLRAYDRELDADNVSRLGLDNGHVDGFLSGAAAFWEEFASAMNRTAENLRDDREDARARRKRRRARDERRDEQESHQRPPPIDYERLARLVAQELKNPQPVVVTPAGTPAKRE